MTLGLVLLRALFDSHVLEFARFEDLSAFEALFLAIPEVVAPRIPQSMQTVSLTPGCIYRPIWRTCIHRAIGDRDW